MVFALAFNTDPTSIVILNYPNSTILNLIFLSVDVKTYSFHFRPLHLVVPLRRPCGCVRQFIVSESDGGWSVLVNCNAFFSVLINVLRSIWRTYVTGFKASVVVPQVNLNSLSVSSMTY